MKINVSLRKLIHISRLLQELSFGEKLLEGNRSLIHDCKTAVVSNLQHHLKNYYSDHICYLLRHKSTLERYLESPGTEKRLACVVL